MAKGPIPGQDDGHGEWHGVPFDVRAPTVARNKSRYWNRDDPRFFTPKVYGAGWTVNVYWLTHLVSYFRQRSRGPKNP